MAVVITGDAHANPPGSGLGLRNGRILVATATARCGDAGERVLAAWGMGWDSAQKTAGRDWLYPYLIYSLTDSYPAVRFDAWKSLQMLPGFSEEMLARMDFTPEAEASVSSFSSATVPIPCPV